MKSLKKTTTKRSLRAKLVAREYIESAVNGSKKTLKEIALAHGYSQASYAHGSITKTKSYKEEIQPVLAQYDRILSNIRQTIEHKDMKDETLVNLSITHKNILHDKHLISGKSTENIATTPQIIIYGSSDPLSQQLQDKALK